MRAKIETERAELKKKMSGIVGQMKTLLPAASEKLNEMEQVSEKGKGGGRVIYGSGQWKSVALSVGIGYR